MKQIDMKNIMEQNSNSNLLKMPEPIQNITFNILNRIINADEINHFISKNDDKRNLDFIDSLFEYLNFSYSVSSIDKLNIPAEGKLICIANHPLGALDGLAIVRAISEVRKDVKIVANDVLLNIENLSDLFLPYNVYTLSAQRENLKKIENAINNDEAVIFFPAAMVSRFSAKGIRDKKWNKGALKFAKKYNAPILPIFVQARNSVMFYSVAALSNKLSMMLLADEIFKQRNKTITLKIGNIIPVKSLKDSLNDENIQTKLLKKHVYKLNKPNKEIFKTEKTIIHPVDSKLIKMELQKSKLLGSTQNDFKIYLAEYETARNVIREIARLREVTFRKVGEGTGLVCDFDIYDKYYKHIVLFDEKNLEIAGSYRIGVCPEILSEFGESGLYNSEEFQFDEKGKEILMQSLEMGRSFIQQKYWRSNALDYLWQGIGAYLSELDNINYMFGAVSISNTYTMAAKEMLIYYYSKWYGGSEKIIHGKNPYHLSKNSIRDLDELFTSGNKQDDFKILKSNLKNMGFSVPVMFKRYSELCDEGGVKFLDFNIDKNFSDCIDGLLVLEIDKIKASARERYYFGKSLTNNSNLSVTPKGELIKEAVMA